MKILFVSSECAPFSKSGGLADVASSLPPALQAEGNEIAVITPLYRCVKERFGKNSLLKAKNFQGGATARERNAQVGGHKA